MFDYGEDDYRGVFVTDVIVDGEEYSSVIACVFEDSNILVSRTKETIQAKNIVKGDNIAYYNFETNSIEIGTVESVYIHKNATNFVKYVFEDGSYLEATDYHPIYTKNGWRSYTRRNGYDVPTVGEEVRTKDGWKKIEKIETWTGLEDCYDFAVIGENGEKVTNYFANDTLVESSI